MIPILTFSIIAFGLVFLAGIRDSARDPRLTVLLLFLLAVFPVLVAVLPKYGIFPSVARVTGGAGLPWGRIFLAIWAMGFAGTVGRLIWAILALQRWRGRSVEVARVAGVAVCEMERLHGPMAAGVFHRVIFVPTSWHTWTEEIRRVVLQHELAHHRRRDPLCRLLVELVLAVYWYHPLVHWMARRFVIQCEYACDTRVLRDGIDPKIYARVLCDFAEQRAFSPLALPMAEISALESRVTRMLKPARGHGGKVLLALGGVGVLAACSISMIDRKSEVHTPESRIETQLRFSANPFPGER